MRRIRRRPLRRPHLCLFSLIVPALLTAAAAAAATEQPPRENAAAVRSGQEWFDVAGNPIAAEPAKKPNIVFILADDLGPGDLGCWGGSIAKTPKWIAGCPGDRLGCGDGEVALPIRVESHIFRNGLGRRLVLNYPLRACSAFSDRYNDRFYGDIAGRWLPRRRLGVCHILPWNRSACSTSQPPDA